MPIFMIQPPLRAGVFADISMLYYASGHDEIHATSLDSRAAGFSFCFLRVCFRAFHAAFHEAKSHIFQFRYFGFLRRFFFSLSFLLAAF